MKQLVFTILFSLLISTGYCKNDPECYNIKRASELIEDEQYASAAEYLDKELQANPNNGFAWLYYAIAYGKSNLYDKAITNINKAIPLLEKDYNNKYMATIVALKAGFYYGKNDWNNAIVYYSESIKLDKTYSKALYWRANCYYKKSDWKNCQSDCNQVIKFEDEYNLGAHKLLGDMNLVLKKYDYAIYYYDKVIDGTDNSSLLGEVFASRAVSNWKLEKKREAIEDALSSVDCYEYKGLRILSGFSIDKEFFPLIKTKVQAKTVKSDNPSYWHIVLGMVYESNNNYVEAVRNYMLAQKKEDTYNLSIMINRQMYQTLKDLCAFDYIQPFYEEVLKSADDPLMYKIDYAYKVLDPAGKPNEAIKLLDECIAEDPENEMAYYVRARIKRYNKMVNEAIEDYSISIMLDEEYPNNYTERADCYKLIGQKGKANEDYKTLLALGEDDDGDVQCSDYALFYLGKTKEVKKKLLDYLKNDAFYDYYDAACLWSLMGEQTNAISSLEKAFEKSGYRDFNHLNRDTDLDNIRNTNEFKKLVAKYMKVHENELTEVSDILKDHIFFDNQQVEAVGSNDASTLLSNKKDSRSLREVSVPFIIENGVTKVKCKVNDLPLTFIFDTGASKVTISSIEATFMYKNGYLQNSDFGSSEYFSTASGEVVEGTIVNLRNVDIGGVTINNVKATVVHNQNAPLLLGQSVLSRLGKIEIDNVNKLLKISSR